MSIFERINLELLEPWIALALAVILSLLLMATSDMPTAEGAKIHLTGILEIFTRPLSIVPRILGLQSENARLRSDLAELRLRVSATGEAMRENERLRRLLDFRTDSDLILQSAEVIGKNPLSGVNSLLISAGLNSGIGKNMAVINDQGLVGKVARVGSRASIVQLLLDRNVGAAVRLSSCRADGITLWGGGQRLFLEGLSSSVPVRLGEEAITSGLDGVFPAGIPVGQVVRTQKAEENLFLEVEIDPAVDFSSLEEVFVVREGPTSLLP